MKRYITALLMAIISIIVLAGEAKALEIRETPKLTIRDAQFYLRPFKGTNKTAGAGAGVCYGSLYTLYRKSGTPVHHYPGFQRGESGSRKA